MGDGMDRQRQREEVRMSEDVMAPMPHALGVEKSVLSILLQFPERMDEIETLTPSHFYLPGNRIVFDAMRATLAGGRELELVSFSERLRETGLLEKIGGPAYLAEIYTYMPSPGHFHQHIEILTENLARRVAIEKGNAMIERAFGGEIDEVADAAKTAASAFESVMTGATAPITLKEILIESMTRFESRARGSEDSMGIQTISLLDEHLRGMHPGRLWVIGAYPEGGKSVMASQIILDAALGGHAALFLSLEMSERDVMDRMIVQQSRVDAKAFMEPKDYARDHGADGITLGLMRPIQRAVQLIAEAPLRIQRPANRKLSTILAAIKRAKREIGIKVAAVDYLQLVKGSGESGNREGEISEVSHALQEVAQESGITLLILSQLNADGDTKHGRVIEEDADAVIQIVQDRNKESETYKQHRHVVIAKDRHYGSGGKRVPLVLDRDKIRFVHGMDETAQASKAKFTR